MEDKFDLEKFRAIATSYDHGCESQEMHTQGNKLSGTSGMVPSDYVPSWGVPMSAEYLIHKGDTSASCQNTLYIDSVRASSSDSEK